MEKKTIEIPEKRFMKLESMVSEILEQTKLRVRPVPQDETKAMLYTPEKFCELFNISRSTFDRMRRDEKLNLSKVGRRIYIEEKEVTRLLKFGLK